MLFGKHLDDADEDDEDDDDGIEDNDDDDKAEEEDPDEDDVDGDKRESHRLRGKTVDATRDKSDRQKKLLSERQSTLKAEDHPHLVHDPLFSTHD